MKVEIEIYVKRAKYSVFKLRVALNLCCDWSTFKKMFIYSICRVPKTSGKQCYNYLNSTSTKNNKLIIIYLINQKSFQNYNGRDSSRKGCT